MSMDLQALRDSIRQYILQELIRDPDYPLRDDEGIITSGLMDSFALAELAVYIETAFSIYIPDPDLTVEKMDSINQIVEQIALKHEKK